ncbi:MAG: glutamine amidotransferase [Peptococcaceae bacterium]|nr:glutamine amidotransferase [Peptococcaceae bacterium]
MKKLLIIKTGTTPSAIFKEHGDFEDFIMDQIEIHPKKVIVSSVFQNESLPDLRNISAIMITGSDAMVTDFDSWSVRLSHWLKQDMDKPVPILGICYGHQLLAHTFGGVVDYHPQGEELGTVTIELTYQGVSDELLGVLPRSFLGHVAHAQTATTLPENSQLLAKNNFEKHHSFCIQKRIWGVQFHPEFTADITLAYIRHEEENLRKEGVDPEKLAGTVQENPYGGILLKRFIQISNLAD